MGKCVAGSGQISARCRLEDQYLSAGSRNAPLTGDSNARGGRPLKLTSRGRLHCEPPALPRR